MDQSRLLRARFDDRVVPTTRQASMTCFLAQFAPDEPCEGRLIHAHLLPRQLLKREFGPTLARKMAADPATYVHACGGMMGNSGHHGQLDTSRTLRVPRESLPEALEAFAATHGLSWYLERNYRASINRDYGYASMGQVYTGTANPNVKVWRRRA